MKKFEHNVIALIPEQISVNFSTTGSCGGDAGHGGEAALTFSMKDGGVGFSVLIETDRESMQIDEVRRMTLATFGDWELEGLAAALIDIGRALIAEDDTLKTWANWKNESDYEGCP